MSYGVGIVGLGVGKGHIDSYRGEGRGEVKVLCDVNADLLRSIATEKGIAETTARFADLAARDDIQLVSVCTPDHLHAEVALPLLEAGKHLLIEKPLATTRKDIRRIVDAAKANGVKIQHGCQLRFMPGFQELRKRIDEGQLGDIFYAEGDYIGAAFSLFTDGWRGALGAEYNAVAGGGVHPIDLMVWFVGSDPMEVHSYGNRIAFEKKDLTAYDCIVSIIKFESGAMAKTLSTFGCVRPGFRNLHVYGTKGTFLTNPVPPANVIADESAPTTWQPIELAGIADSRVGLIADWIDAIEHDREPLLGARTAAMVASVTVAAFESLHSGKPEPVDRF